MKANELKKGVVFRSGSQNVMVRQVQVQSPSSRSGNTLYKVSGQDVVSRQKFEKSFKGDETLDAVDIARRPVQLLYRDSDGFTFMDTETYDQYVLDASALEDETVFLTDGMAGIVALISEGALLGIELPATIVLEISDTTPAMKAASSSARTKPATLSTGLVIQVPEYLTPGETVKVNTETREYVSRV